MSAQVDAAWKAGYLTGYGDLGNQLADNISELVDLLLRDYEYTDRIDAAVAALNVAMNMIADLAEATALQFMPQGKEGAQ